MPFYTVQAIIPTTDNVAANYATNTWTFEADDLTALGLACDALEDFYNDLDTYFSSMVRQTDFMLKCYDNTDPEPRAPVLTREFDLSSAPSGAPLPPEVSICLSFQADQVSGVPQARRRGRIYIPFVDTSTMGTDGRPTGTVVTNIASYGDTLLTASNGAATWTWLVFSRVEPGYSVISNGWVDNEYDTQRRRGRPYTSRVVFN